MEGGKEIFLKYREEEYMQVPEQIREMYLRDKIYSESVNDFSELMKDDHYRKLYNEKRKISKDLEAYTFHLREQRRKQLISK